VTKKKPRLGRKPKPKKRTPEQRLVDDVVRLFKVATDHHQPQTKAPKTKDGDFVTCVTASPKAALAAYDKAFAKLDTFPGELRTDVWVREFEANAHFNVACMYSILGEKDKAFASLERLVKLNAFTKIELIEKDADLAPLREEARFGDLLARAKAVGRLTVGKVILESIAQGTLTAEGVDPKITEEIKSRVVFHHEWIRSPDLQGPSCYMLASFPGTEAQLVHDTVAKTIFPATKLDFEKVVFSADSRASAAEAKRP
jgi:hypothetical protein